LTVGEEEEVFEEFSECKHFSEKFVAFLLSLETDLAATDFDGEAEE